MESIDGQLAVSYLVKCALPSGRSVTKYDDEGNLQTFQGSIGVAPEWVHETSSIVFRSRWVSLTVRQVVPRAPQRALGQRVPSKHARGDFTAEFALRSRGSLFA